MNREKIHRNPPDETSITGWNSIYLISTICQYIVTGGDCYCSCEVEKDGKIYQISVHEHICNNQIRCMDLIE